jgi:hypothetical protein
MRRNLPGGASLPPLPPLPPLRRLLLAPAPAAGRQARAAPAGREPPRSCAAPRPPPRRSPASAAPKRSPSSPGARDLGVETRATELVQQNEAGQVGVDAARSALLQAAAEAPARRNGPGSPGSITVTRDGDETTRGDRRRDRRPRAADEVPEASRQYMG